MTTTLTHRPPVRRGGWLRVSDDLRRHGSLPDPAGVRTRVVPDLEVERAVARLAAAWVATDDPNFREMGRDTARAHVAAIVDDELEDLRILLDFDTARARLEVHDIAAETAVYLEHALDPTITYADLTTYVRTALAGRINGAALAAAAVRGWAERTRLAGGAR